MKYIYTFIFILLFAQNTFVEGQTGHLLIVGGGTEYNDTDETWNHDAYKWAVDHAENKKVAILHYSSGSDWLEDYFVSDCGAVEAVSFVVNSSGADNSAIMSSLEEYDMFFLRGGDQWRYYSYWKDKAIHQLLQEKYDNGAVLAGTSAGLAVLSEVVYTAENNSAYTDISIKKIDDNSHTLANDLFGFAPGLLFDSHFTDRGRMGRLVAFMAKWLKDEGDKVTGIGVDESTAFAISDGMGYAFGSGAVNIFRPGEQDFGTGPLLRIDSLKVTQLLHGDSINMTTFTAYGQDDHPALDASSNWPTQEIYLSGSDNISSTAQQMLNDFISAGSGNSDPICIISGTDLTQANSYKTWMEGQGAGDVSVWQALYSEVDNQDMKTALESAKKFLVIDNSAYNLNGFLQGGENGTLLLAKIGNSNSILFFAGDNSRYAGATTVSNYLTPNASENGSLSLSSVFDIIENCVIIPNTLEKNEGGGSITDIWHSTFAALPYAMVSEDIPAGLWLNHENGIQIFSDEGSAKLKTYGSSPVIMLNWSGGKAGLAEQTFKGKTNEQPRQIAGFHNALLSFLQPGSTLTLGDIKVGTEASPESKITVYPNPADNMLRISMPVAGMDVHLIDMLGRPVTSYRNTAINITIPLEDVVPGFYFLAISDRASDSYSTKQILIVR